MARYEAEGKTIIYLDESGFAHDSPRQYGYAPKGQRCFGIHNWSAKGRINAIGAIIGFTFLTLALFDSTINSDVFYAWLTQDLLPKAPKGAVIVMDNATFHKRHDMVKAIDESGCRLVFLPPYRVLTSIRLSINGRKPRPLESNISALSMSYFLFT